MSKDNAWGWTQKQIEEALEIRFDSDAGKNLTLRGYFCELLMALWVEGEGFSGKRPFGNSGWDHDIYRALVVGGVIRGRLDADGFLDDFDRGAANDLVPRLIITALGLEVDD